MLFTKCFFKYLPKHVQGFSAQMQIAIRNKLTGPPDWQLWPRQVRDTSNPFHVFSQGLVICNHVLRTSEQSPDLAGYLWKDYHKFSKATAMMCAETREEFTYEQIRHLSLAFGVGLKNLSILNRRGDILAIICPNMPSFAICFYGAVFIHGVPALINPKGCIVAQLRACKPKAVVVLAKDAKHVQYMTEVEEELMSIRTIIISVGVHEEEKLMKDLQPNGPRSPKLLSLREVICNSSKDGLGILSGAPFRPDDIAIVQCLRKANGKEMAVALSHGNIVGTLNQLHVPYLSKAEKAHIIREGHNPMKLFHQETIVGIMPFYTAFGLITGLLSCTKIGGRLITLSEDEPNELLFDILEEYQVMVRQKHQVSPTWFLYMSTKNLGLLEVLWQGQQQLQWI
ncbi:unnamed protein product [Notodromas monacha]|uniref:AMP-dependent synthetase/ligase domain-containing protein n=1 Tax=Notodromas monacha TaxID=399045 RepID=A0A7R9GGG5_9CRUS|nr:unnamed protein product [Notodromas monacha]CAG0920168.1 unnamed protein product [Notodromas monacha]